MVRVKEHVARCNQVDKLCTACEQVELTWSRGWARVFARLHVFVSYGLKSIRQEFGISNVANMLHLPNWFILDFNWQECNHKVPPQGWIRIVMDRPSIGIKKQMNIEVQNTRVSMIWLLYLQTLTTIPSTSQVMFPS